MICETTLTRQVSAVSRGLSCKNVEMLTRSQVARFLNRSITTVRRMEGNELHPDVAQNGVHLFDEDEVEELAEEMRETGRRRDEYAEDLPSFILARQLATAEARVGELEQLAEEDAGGYEEVAEEVVRDDDMLTDALELLNVSIRQMPPGPKRSLFVSKVEKFADKVEAHLAG